MPPKTVFTKEEVVNAAVKVIEKSGINSLTARKIAAVLKSSTAPVYSCFRSMKDLKHAALIAAKELLLVYSAKPHTDRVFLNIGTGLVLFAKEYTNLFYAIFTDAADHLDVIDDFKSSLVDDMNNDPRFTHFSWEEREALFTKMWIFTHGYASLICSGYIKNSSRESIINTLLETGSIIIGAAINNSSSK